MESKSERAALGFRVKSGWAAAVLVGGSVRAPRICDSFAIDLCDPRLPETRQPYHAAMGKLETNTLKLRARLQVVSRVTRQSITKVLVHCRRNNFRVRQAGLVVGSKIDPALIANPHIRAHALEGQLFRTALANALRTKGIHSMILTERDAYAEAATRRKRSVVEIRGMIQSLGRSAGGPWCSEQKLAALAAWIALGQ